MRRRFCILAAAAACLPRLAGATPGAAPLTWTGPVLGGVGSITLHHPDPAVAQALLRQSVAELTRLEAMFSLWREDSLLCTLNRQGMLVAPPPELHALLAEAQRIAALSEGSFDVTVQPVWALYRAHFLAADADPAGPPPAALAAALALVDWRRLLVSPDRILLGRRGMALTLNGIAQGFITDRIAELLQRGGIAHTLVNLGEARALGEAAAGRAWRAAFEDPEAPGRNWGEVGLRDRALACSGDAGFVFDAAGRFSHLLDPRTGRSPRRYRAVAVLAPTAALADGLSTSLALLPEARIAAMLRALPAVEARLLRHDGSIAVLRGGGA